VEAIQSILDDMLGDFDRAEEALHDAFAAAAEQWPRDGVPENPRTWLVSTGRFRAINAWKRRMKFTASLAFVAARLQNLKGRTGGLPPRPRGPRRPLPATRPLRRGPHFLPRCARANPARTGAALSRRSPPELG